MPADTAVDNSDATSRFVSPAGGPGRSAGPDTPSLAYLKMKNEAEWRLIWDILGGTRTMRKAGKRWLPREPAEEPAAYRVRLLRSFLFNMFGDALEKLSAKPFQQEVTIEPNKDVLPEPLEPLLSNTDLNGMDLTEFARKVFKDALKYGVTHVLVDTPVIDGLPPEAKLTIADEQRLDIRPFFTHVSPPSLIAWDWEKGVNGKKVLTSIRIKEMRIVKDGEFGQKKVDHIRRITRDDWSLWGKGPEDKDFKLVKGPIPHDLEKVHLYTFYTNQTGFLTGRSPLEDLLWLNLAHWQSMSDQRNILRFARVGTIFLSGVTEEEMEEGITIGPRNLIRSANKDAKMSVVEHTGKAIESGEKDLQKLEERGQILGMQPLMERQGERTATEVGAGESRSSSLIQAWIRGEENLFNDCFDAAAEISNQTLPDDFKVNIFSDFILLVTRQADGDFLLKVCVAGKITDELFLSEIQMRGFISEMVDVKDEAAAAKLIADQKAEAALDAAKRAGFGADEEGDDDDNEDEDE